MVFDIVGFLEKQYGYMPKPRAIKVQTLFDLAYHCKQGQIVELGAYHGLGTAALCIGVQMAGYEEAIQVYTIDDYIDRKGWIGEEYRPVDRGIFEHRMRTLLLHPELIVGSIREIGEKWDIPLGILFWDAGVMGEMMDDIVVWAKHVLPGGMIYLHDTSDCRLGSREVAQYLITCGYEIIRDEPGVMLLKKVKDG